MLVEAVDFLLLGIEVLEGLGGLVEDADEEEVVEDGADVEGPVQEELEEDPSQQVV